VIPVQSPESCNDDESDNTNLPTMAESAIVAGGINPKVKLCVTIIEFGTTPRVKMPYARKQQFHLLQICPRC
jgi:hypothetical protein